MRLLSHVCLLPSALQRVGSSLCVSKVSCANMPPFFSFNLNCQEEMRVVSRLGASTSVNFIPKSLLDFYVGRNKYLWIISRAFSHIPVLFANSGELLT